MLRIDRKSKALILLSVVAVAAILGGLMLTIYATDNGQANANDIATWMPGPHGWLRGRGCGCYGTVEVSAEFKQNVLNIAQNDTDVQNLLNQGYNLTAVKPIIKTVIEANGDVTTKATSAIIILSKDTTGKAGVWVDLEQGKVTKIVTLTKTVIEKS
jgi:hypothetical protein